MKKKMKTTCALVFAVVFACAGAIMTGVQAQEKTIKTPVGSLSFTQDFANGDPTDATVKKIYDARDFQRAAKSTDRNSTPE